MHDDYRDTFDRRGLDYHAAMRLLPGARRQEFERVARAADCPPGSVVCDVPAGGGYLAPYLPGCRLVQVESSLVFARHARSAILADLRSWALRSGSVDRVISIASLHHVGDHSAFYREAYRVLRSGGVACFADAARDSPPARFLDGFVSRHSRDGHVGNYIGPEVADQLTAVGFEQIEIWQEKYFWSFPSPALMVRFCTLIFGLTEIEDSVILNELEGNLGVLRTADGWQLSWGLQLCRSRKP